MFVGQQPDCMVPESKWEQLCLLVVYQCAPVFRGVKISNLVTLPKGMWFYLFHTLQNTGVQCKILYSGEQKEVLFFFRENAMSRKLKDVRVREFIREYGYLETDSFSVIRRLQSRYTDFMEQKAHFPHELGIFLDYPPEDVRSFIENHGKNYIISGYWKVYHNPGKAADIFASYDQARKIAARDYLRRRDIRQIVKIEMEAAS